MEYPNVNFHIHSKFSDGENTIHKIVDASLKLGLEYIAITDHFSNSWKSKLIPTLDSHEKINNYLKKIKYCKHFLQNSKEHAVLFTGIEIDVGSSKEYIYNFINPKKFDLILFEYLESFEGIAFIKNLINHWNLKIKHQKFPIFGLAHFDPSLFMYDGISILLNFLEDYMIYFEFNSSYSQFYSRKYQFFFEELKEHDIPITIGCDSHDLKSLNNGEEPLQMIKYYGLERNYKLFLDKIRSTTII